MKNRFSLSTLLWRALIAVGFLATASAAGQAPSNGAPASSWTVTRTPDGQPICKESGITAPSRPWNAQRSWEQRNFSPMRKWRDSRKMKISARTAI